MLKLLQCGTLIIIARCGCGARFGRTARFIRWGQRRPAGADLRGGSCVWMIPKPFGASAPINCGWGWGNANLTDGVIYTVNSNEAHCANLRGESSLRAILKVSNISMPINCSRGGHVARFGRGFCADYWDPGGGGQKAPLGEEATGGNPGRYREKEQWTKERAEESEDGPQTWWSRIKPPRQFPRRGLLLPTKSD
ncbi:hypothetical protein C8J57DRAFT_1236977 [Mycena rebaudengoi]|nr:hypothetical protein C8J57DRAFT_1236977 [Mycena rebaudengoi]